MRVVARPGLKSYAGPTRRQLIIARGLPVLLPLLCKLIAVSGLHLTSLFLFVCAAALLASARGFLETGIGLGMIMLIQLAAALVATGLLGLNLVSPAEWLRLSGITLLMVGYVSFVFNLAGSYLPR